MKQYCYRHRVSRGGAIDWYYKVGGEKPDSVPSKLQDRGKSCSRRLCFERVANHNFADAEGVQFGVGTEMEETMAQTNELVMAMRH